MSDTDRPTTPAWFQATLGFILAVSVLLFALLDSTDAYNFNETIVLALLVAMLILVGAGPILVRLFEAKYGD